MIKSANEISNKLAEIKLLLDNLHGVEVYRIEFSSSWFIYGKFEKFKGDDDIRTRTLKEGTKEFTFDIEWKDNNEFFALLKNDQNNYIIKYNFCNVLNSNLFVLVRNNNAIGYYEKVNDSYVKLDSIEITNRKYVDDNSKDKKIGKTK